MKTLFAIVAFALSPSALAHHAFAMSNPHSFAGARIRTPGARAAYGRLAYTEGAPIQFGTRDPIPPPEAPAAAAVALSPVHALRDLQSVDKDLALWQDAQLRVRARDLNAPIWPNGHGDGEGLSPPERFQMSDRTRRRWAFFAASIVRARSADGTSWRIEANPLLSALAEKLRAIQQKPELRARYRDLTLQEIYADLDPATRSQLAREIGEGFVARVNQKFATESDRLQERGARFNLDRDGYLDFLIDVQQSIDRGFVDLHELIEYYAREMPIWFGRLLENGVRHLFVACMRHDFDLTHVGHKKVADTYLRRPTAASPKTSAKTAACAPSASTVG